MSSKLRKRIKSLNGLFFHEHENKKASNGPVDHFFLRPRNWKGATARVDHFFMSSKLRKRIKSLNGLFFHEHENKKAN